MECVWCEKQDTEQEKADKYRHTRRRACIHDLFLLFHLCGYVSNVSSVLGHVHRPHIVMSLYRHLLMFTSQWFLLSFRHKHMYLSMYLFFVHVCPCTCVCIMFHLCMYTVVEVTVILLVCQKRFPFRVVGVFSHCRTCYEFCGKLDLSNGIDVIINMFKSEACHLGTPRKCVECDEASPVMFLCFQPQQETGVVWPSQSGVMPCSLYEMVTREGRRTLPSLSSWLAGFVTTSSSS